MQHYQVFTSIVSVLFFIIVITLIRKDSILMGAALRWLLIAIGTLILGLYPQLSDVFAEYLNISYAPILPLLVACLLLMVKALLADIERAKTQVKLDRLAQDVALLKVTVMDLKSNK